MSIERKHLHELIEQISDGDIPTVAEQLEKIIKKLQDKQELYSITDILNGVPIPEEEVSPEEMKIINERIREIDKSKGISLDDFDKEFGL